MSTTRKPLLADDETLRLHADAAKRLKSLHDIRIRYETTLERSEAAVLEDITASRNMGIQDDEPGVVLNTLRSFVTENRQHNSDVLPAFVEKLTKKERDLAAAETQQAV
jgi:hypothetical protein